MPCPYFISFHAYPPLILYQSITLFYISPWIPIPLFYINQWIPIPYFISTCEYLSLILNQPVNTYHFILYQPTISTLPLCSRSYLSAHAYPLLRRSCPRHNGLWDYQLYLPMLLLFSISPESPIRIVFYSLTVALIPNLSRFLTSSHPSVILLLCHLRHLLHPLSFQRRNTLTAVSVLLLTISNIWYLLYIVFPSYLHDLQLKHFA